MSAEQIASGGALAVALGKLLYDFVKDRSASRVEGARVDVEDDARRDAFVKTITDILEKRIDKLHDEIDRLNRRIVEVEQQRDHHEAVSQHCKRRVATLERVMLQAGMEVPRRDEPEPSV